MTFPNDSTLAAVPASVRFANALTDALRGPAVLARGAFAALRRAKLRHVTLRQLRGLDDRLLADVGLSRADLHQVVDRLVRQQA